MKLYKARIRLAGNLLHEVWVQDVSAAELHVLMEIHKGGDNFPLAEVIETGAVNRTDARERRRLELKYLDWNLGNGAKLIKEVLGMPGAPLPQKYEPPVVLGPEEDDFDEFSADEAEPEKITTLEQPVDVIKPVRTRVPKGGLNPENVVQ
jgi:hypothetical protein